MSLITPMGSRDVRLAMYDVNGERRAVVKVHNGVHIVEDECGSWIIFKPERREFALLGEAVDYADAYLRE